MFIVCNFNIPVIFLKWFMIVTGIFVHHLLRIQLKEKRSCKVVSVDSAILK